MTDYYLKLPSEASMSEVFAEFYQNDVLVAGPDFAIDVVGVIYRETGVLTHDGNGNIVPEVELVNGWHVNVRTLSEEADEKFAPINETYGVSPSPETPVRTWL